MKVKETFVIKVTRTTECIEQCYDETLDSVNYNLEDTKQHIVDVLEEQGFKVSEGGFISANVTGHSA